jgi:hypothetical protein
MREVSAHAQNDNRSVAAEIFAISTYFLNTPRTMATKLFTLGIHGNYGNQVVYCRVKITYRHCRL